MKTNQEKFEAKIVKMCQEDNVNNILEYIANVKPNQNLHWQPDGDFLDAIASLDITSEKKMEVIDKIIELYDDRVKEYFSWIVSKTLELGNDVEIPLLLKYSNPNDFVDLEPIIAFLWKQNRLDLIDAFIQEFPADIRNSIFTMKYVNVGNEEIISYVLSKWVKPKPIEEDIEVIEIHLVGENMSAYEMKIEDLESVKVNGLFIEDFIKSNDKYIENMKVVSTVKFVDKEWDYDDEDEGLVPYLSNIVYFQVYFKHKEMKHYGIPWFSDQDDYTDYLQRYIEKDGKYIWTYDKKHISNVYFESYGFEEKIKFDNDLPNEHKITIEDLVDIKSIFLKVSQGGFFSDVSSFIDDLKRLPNLDEISICLVGYGTKENPTIYDVSRLKELNNVSKINLSSEYDAVQLLGIDTLVKEWHIYKKDNEDKNYPGIINLDMSLLNKKLRYFGGKSKSINK